VDYTLDCRNKAWIVIHIPPSTYVITKEDDVHNLDSGPYVEYDTRMHIFTVQPEPKPETQQTTLIINNLEEIQNSINEQEKLMEKQTLEMEQQYTIHNKAANELLAYWEAHKEEYEEMARQAERHERFERKGYMILLALWTAYYLARFTQRIKKYFKDLIENYVFLCVSQLH